MQQNLAKNFRLLSAIKNKNEFFQGIRAGLSRSSWSPTKKLISNFRRLEILAPFIKNSLAEKAISLNNSCDITDWFSQLNSIMIDSISLKYLNTPLRKCLDQKKKTKKSYRLRCLEK